MIWIAIPRVGRAHVHDASWSSWSVATDLVRVVVAGQGVGQTSSFLGDSAAAKAAAARIFAVVDRKPAINSADEGGERPPAVKGIIELR